MSSIIDPNDPLDRWWSERRQLVGKKIDWIKFPQKQDTTPLTKERVKEVTKPWSKEKETKDG